MIRIVTENWHYKLFAVALATVFWFLIVDESELATTISAPVEYKNIPRDLEMTSDIEERVRLELRGPAGKLRPDLIDNTIVVIDLDEVKRSGEHTFTIRQSNTNLAPGVSLERAIPARIRLQFERRISRTVPVSVRIGTNPRDGYEIASITAEPPQIAITGAESRVRTVDSVETDPVDLADVQDAAQFDVETYASEPQVRIDGSAKVKVKVRVRQKDGAGN